MVINQMKSSICHTKTNTLLEKDDKTYSSKNWVHISFYFNTYPNNIDR